jgi:hypothetical protein
MIESPVLQEFVADAQRKSIILVLIERLGPAANAIGPALSAITDSEKLDDLTRLSAKCPDLETFRQEVLTQE